MPTYDSPDELAASLQVAGVDCGVVEDGFITVPIDGHDFMASIRLEYGWVVFKLFVGEWGSEIPASTARTLLQINRRLLGFRFAAEGGDIWVQEEFSPDFLNDDFHVFVFHAVDVLSTVIPALLPFFESGTQMSEEDINAVFGLIESTAAN